MCKPRVRFWIESALVGLTTILLLVTLVSREWIEILFGVDPDDGNGSLEWAIVGLLIAFTITFILIARAEWRKRAGSPG
jgi:hypothetical protein